jgi:alkylated DNA repair dioxygenase AlkB
MKKLVRCPVCDTTVSSSIINLHLEICLKRDERSSVARTDPINQPTDCAKDALSELPGRTMSVTIASDPTQASELVTQDVPSLPGLFLIEDFISKEEEAAIIQELDADPTPWQHSNFNGQCNSKRFGVRTQLAPPRLVRPNDPAAGEMDIPEYLAYLPLRLRRALAAAGRRLPAALRDFAPNECNANSYETSLGHHLTPHFDDRALSGPVLMNLSLGCPAHMTFHAGEDAAPPPAAARELHVRLPARCLQLVTGPARYSYRHSIRADAIAGPRRVSVTWRQAGARGSPVAAGIAPAAGPPGPARGSP